MEELLDMLVYKGYLVFFLWILVNRLGVPLPATPALLAAGALAAMGIWRIALVLLLAVVATLASDTVWFELGRRYGQRVLRLLCRMTLNPEKSAHRAEDFLARHGARSLLISKFVPGMNRTVLPLTGTAQISLPRFLAFDCMGALLWAGVYSGLGYAFSDTLEQAVGHSQRLGWYAGAVLVFVIAVSLAVWKYTQRMRQMGDDLELEHVTPHQLKEQLEMEEDNS